MICVHGRGYAVLALLGAMAGCGTGGDGGEGAAAAGDPELDGATREEIERRGEAMSPAVAESLGIIDSTIHMEQLDPGDVPVPGGDTAVVPPGY